MMKSFRIGAVALATLASAPALAAPASFVSVRGTDTGNCAAITTPCRTFAYALGQTSTHGEIFAIAPGDYGPVTINKSISITGTVDGAGITSAATVSGLGNIAHIIVDAGANGLVYLTGLTLNGSVAPGFPAGVVVREGTRVIIRDCAIRNYSFGINVATGGASTLLDDAFSRAPIFIGPESRRGVIHRVSAANAQGDAITLFGSGGTMISESSISGSGSGVFARTHFFLTRSAISNNANFGVSDQGVVNSAHNNLIRGNGVNVQNPVNNIGTR